MSVLLSVPLIMKFWRNLAFRTAKIQLLSVPEGLRRVFWLISLFVYFFAYSSREKRSNGYSKIEICFTCSGGKESDGGTEHTTTVRPTSTKRKKTGEKRVKKAWTGHQSGIT